MQVGDRVYHTDLHEYATIISKEATHYRVKYDGNNQVFQTKRYWLIKVEDDQQ